MLNKFYEYLLKMEDQEINTYAAVGAVIIKNSSLLLLKRNTNIYEIPNDTLIKKEHLDEALHRVVKEKTGLAVKEIKKNLSSFDYEQEGGKKIRQFNFLVAVEEPFEIKLNEHIGFLWLNKDIINDYQMSENIKFILYLLWGK